MKISNLLVSGVSISEYEYDYKGIFFLGCENMGCEKEHLKLDLADFESNDETVLKVKHYFNLEEDIKTIQKIVLDKVMIKAGLDSKDVHGENYNKDSDATGPEGTFDRA